MWIYVSMFKNLLSAGIEQKMYYQDCPEWHTCTGSQNLIPFFYFIQDQENKVDFLSSEVQHI